ncbi:MAG TPA: transketolase C-terminal domain-containing protein [Longilinea sp.]|nr:transketolase C-terminal domain-containing protein [Longilinea sp.]
MAEISMREAYGKALAAYGAINPRLVVLDVDTACSTLSSHFARQFPDRFYNIGIAEPCMVDVAVGLALGGLIPFANAFAALLALRSLEAIRTNVCYARTNVKIAASYAGLSDFKDGATHYAVTDIANLRALPGMTVIAPADGAESADWVPLVAEFDGPIYLRLNRAGAIPVHTSGTPLQIGKGIQRRAGSDVVIFACGTMTGRSLKAAEELAKVAISVRVVEIHTIKPLDVELVCQAAAETGAVVTAEEHSVIGGLGSAVAEALAENYPTPLQRVGLRDVFARTALDPDSLMDAYGMGTLDVVKAVHEVIKRKK